MSRGSPAQPLLFGDVVVLAFDVAQRLTPNRRLAALLASIALDEVAPRGRRRRAAPRPEATDRD
jgi:hypothetical protein